MQHFKEHMSTHLLVRYLILGGVALVLLAFLVRTAATM